MISALGSAVSGLRDAVVRLDVTASNIAAFRTAAATPATVQTLVG